MRQDNLRGIDLNLLPVLDALLRLRSVTAAAAAVNLSQPAASRALGRLRLLLDDPLLLRGPRGMMLSERATTLRPILADVLGNIGALISQSPLDLSSENRTFRIAMSDAHAVLVLPSVVARLEREAPGVTLANVGYTADISARMANAELDIVVALSTTPLPPGAVSRPLARDDLAVVTSARHPSSGRNWAMEDYGRWPSIAIALVGDGTSDMDTLLARAAVTRRIAATVPNFVAAMAIVGSTDAVTTVSRAAAMRFRTTFDLTIRDAPFAETKLAMTLVTSATRKSDRLLDWLCGLLAEEAQIVFES